MRLTTLAVSVLAAMLSSSASAQTVITQAKALAGGITPGDTAGFPITISQPGAYRLDGNLSVPPNVYGIYIIANNVDLDMNGFALTGNGTGTWGVISPNSESRIHSGEINRFRYSGIYLRASAWTIEDMKITRNGTLGVDATGSSLVTFRNSLVSSNGTTGIVSGEFTRLDSVTVVENGKHGVALGDNCVITNSTFSKNSQIGLQVGGGGKIEGNDVYFNGYHGIFVTDGGLITSNLIKRNAWNAVRSQFNPASLSNNYIRDNSTAVGFDTQVFGGINTYGNVCLGKACF